MVVRNVPRCVGRFVQRNRIEDKLESIGHKECPMFFVRIRVGKRCNLLD